MSEYQYYEFRAIDRPLDEKEMDELGDLSSRAEITPTSFTNTYNYGNFRGDPAKLMDRYFDAFVYVANWGTHRLMFRIPGHLFDAKTALAYCHDDGFSIKAAAKHVVLEFESDDEEGGGWAEGEGWMSSLIPLRAELMRGDFRALYVAWLASLRWLEVGDEDDRLEPPIPPGLAKLSAPLKSLADFLRVEDELIEVAAAGSHGKPPAEPTSAELARWLKGVPSADKDAYLLRLLEGDGDLLLRAELSNRFREATAPKKTEPASIADRRTVGQLLAARDALVAEKNRTAAERKAMERARLERERSAARAKHLDELARRGEAAWQEVEALIAAKSSKEYDLAVVLLADLRELAARSGGTAQADARIREIRRQHAKKYSLMERFDKKGLGK
jgi:hypothetical protein